MGAIRPIFPLQFYLSCQASRPLEQRIRCNILEVHILRKRSVLDAVSITGISFEVGDLDASHHGIFDALIQIVRHVYILAVTKSHVWKVDHHHHESLLGDLI